MEPLRLGGRTVKRLILNHHTVFDGFSFIIIHETGIFRTEDADSFIAQAFLFKKPLGSIEFTWTFIYNNKVLYDGVPAGFNLLMDNVLLR